MGVKHYSKLFQPLWLHLAAFVFDMEDILLILWRFWLTLGGEFFSVIQSFVYGEAQLPSLTGCLVSLRRWQKCPTVASPCCFLLEIWKERIRHMFDNVLKKVGVVVNTIKRDVSKWASIEK